MSDFEKELARHRQMHQPHNGASVCECGEWEGPFTMTEGVGSYADHLALAIAPLVADVWDEGVEYDPKYMGAYLRALKMENPYRD